MIPFAFFVIIAISPKLEPHVVFFSFYRLIAMVIIALAMTVIASNKKALE